MAEQVIRTDIFDYEAAFLAYKDSNNDHEKLSLFNHTFLKLLEDQGLFCREDQTTLVGDIGCGDGGATVHYLKNIQFKGGLDVRVTDKQPEFAGSDTSSDQNKNSKACLAEEILSNAKQSQIIPLKNYQVRYGDILADDVAQLLYTNEEMKASMNRFDLVYLSHILYYARYNHQNGRYGVTHVVDSVATDLLSENGVAILFHSGLRFSKYAYFRIAYFTRGVIQNVDPTDEEIKRLSTDCAIRDACNELGLTCFEIPYKFDLCFSKDIRKYSDIYKDPSRYHELRGNPSAIKDLRVIIFMSHRSPEDLYADKSPRGLNNLVDRIVDAVENNGCVDLFSFMQIILSRKASAEFKQKIERAVKECQNQLCS
ncbi:hypothetical protein TrispH2_011258 [Trichoplax sp. H2]|uniref:Methyltransferase domain-containing protein n=1 Tax=Trichoplax adhaerens TaxID=10228 RepID=B3SAP8_TRIAD|nr:predicted protein [Trichoplax adhaerens]EDV20193.1 predicted protein [Trichoplax adhaerens]RDD36793.1 hypothetical protein TrispH2_011258 [Trichoplax sp. H2]|eukprot:XP_002117354.1 predicted protein [Trichoplax adhaerens]